VPLAVPKNVLRSDRAFRDGIIGGSIRAGGSLSGLIVYVALFRRALLWTSRLGVCELVVPLRVGVPLMKLPEFLQTS